LAATSTHGGRRGSRPALDHALVCAIAPPRLAVTLPQGEGEGKHARAYGWAPEGG